MKRRCSQCNTSNGHNARTCSTRCGGGGGGLKLFGVRLTDGSSVKKSASMGNLSHYSAVVDSMEGYHSDYLNHSLAAGGGPMRKKGIPWTEEEHMQFLLGLHKLGRGNWRGISRNFVPSRTSTQVASHAQKYFIRKSNTTGKKKRPSLFDLAPDMETNSSVQEQFTVVSTKDEKLVLPSSQEVDIKNSLHSQDLTLKLAFKPFPFQLWPPNAYSLKGDESQTSQHHIVGPVQVQQEETMKMSQLSLGESNGVQIDL